MGFCSICEDRSGEILFFNPDIEADRAAWIARQPEPKPSRPEAIRGLIKQAMKASRS